LSCTHTGHATEPLEGVVVLEGGLLGLTERVGEGVDSRDSGDAIRGVLDDLAVLDIEMADLLESAGVGAVSSDELSDNGHLLVGVEGLSGTIEGRVTHTVGVEVTPVLVTDTGVSLITVTALGTRATGLALNGARVRSVGSGDGVCFPNIHLRAASTVGSGTGVRVTSRWGPSINVGLVKT